MLLGMLGFIFAMSLNAHESFAVNHLDTQEQQHVLNVINNHRGGLNLKKLQLNPEKNVLVDELIAANISAHNQTIKAAMAEGYDPWQVQLFPFHRNLDGEGLKVRVRKLGPEPEWYGEVINCGSDLNTAESALNMFLSSDSHKVIIESVLPTHVSVGSAYDQTVAGCGYYWSWYFEKK